MLSFPQELFLLLILTLFLLTIIFLISLMSYPAVDLPTHVKTIIITGSGGFVGQRLLLSLLHHYPTLNIVLTDISAPRIPVSLQDKKHQITSIAGDLSKEEDLKKLFDGRSVDLVYALHGIMSGGSEADFELGYRVNVDSHVALLKATTAHHKTRSDLPLPIYVYASGLAVYGGPKCLPEANVNPDTTPLFPETSYGTGKAIVELYVYDYTRKGYLDGRILRLPTVAIRAGAPSSAASSFISGLIREPLSGKRSLCPVADGPDDPNLTKFPVYLSRVSTIIHNFIYAASLPSSVFCKHSRTVNLPGITTTPAGILDALRAVGGEEAMSLVDFERDEKVLHIMSAWPGSFENETALKLGFVRDSTETGFTDAVKDFKRELEANYGAW